MFNRILIFCLHLFMIHQCYPQCTYQDTSKYFNCVTSQRQSDPWSYRRPYSNLDTVTRCLTDAGCQNIPNYQRSLFADFRPQYQLIANKMWAEYLAVPDNIRQCVRLIVVKYFRNRLDRCVQSLGLNPPGQYPEDIELPFSGLAMPSPGDVESMKVDFSEKLAVLHGINVCKSAQGQASAVKASDCIDAIRRNYMVKNFCNASIACLKSQFPETCATNVERTRVATCQCARSYRDYTIANIDRMYLSGSINVMKLVGVFLGFDLSPALNAEIKKCYTDNGREPITILKFLDDPLLGGMSVSTAEAKPEGVQSLREMSYVQYDLPDYCEQCSN